jgi:hypothetical protein
MLLLSCRMSDLLLPFLLLMDDDALAFWCFVSLMQRMGARHNFAVDERGIFGQLRLLGQVRSTAQHTARHMLMPELQLVQPVHSVLRAHGSPAPAAVVLVWVLACLLAGVGVQRWAADVPAEAPGCSGVPLCVPHGGGHDAQGHAHAQSEHACMVVGWHMCLPDTQLIVLL